MSLRVQSLVWERVPYSAGTLLVFLALADWSNDEGESWPSMPTLAIKARMSERNAQMCIRQVKKDGFLSVKRGGGMGKSNHYLINIDRLQALPAIKITKAQRSRQTVQIFHPLKGEADITQTVKSATSKGEICDIERVKPTSPDPSLDTPLKEEPPKEPTITAALRAARVADIGRLMSFLARQIGAIPNTGAQAKAAGWLLDQGYEMETLRDCLIYLTKHPSQQWRTTAVTWQTVQKEIGPWSKKNARTEESTGTYQGPGRLRKGLNEQ